MALIISRLDVSEDLGASKLDSISLPGIAIVLLLLAIKQDKNTIAITPINTIVFFVFILLHAKCFKLE
jgi:hypothetical protein